jgi:putative ABC transport system permease protein
MVENLVLALPGAILGVIAGQWLVQLFVAGLPPSQRASLPRLQQLGLDLPTVALSAGVVIGAVFVFGLMPAIRTSRVSTMLSSRGAVGLTRRDLWLQGGFIASQSAVALVLLFGAGLMGQSVRRLLDVSPGFQTSQLLTGTISMSGDRYPTPEAVAAFHRQALDAIAAIPGVRGAASINDLPLTGRSPIGALSVAGDPAGGQNTVLVRTVTANYFGVMGIPLLSGRPFQTGDRVGAPPVVLVNRQLADAVFSGNAIGRRVTFPFSGPTPLEIVGVVGDEQFDALDQPLRPVVYFPYEQGPIGEFSLVVRTAGEPTALASSVRAAVARLDPALPVYQVRTMDEIMASGGVFRRRMVLRLMSGFAVAALLLAAVGLYGVLAQVVAHRKREIGIRLALGARGRAIAAAVLKPGFVAVGAGLVLGVLGCLAGGRLLGSLLYQTAATDLTALALVVIVLIVAASAASVAPVRRALRVDPAESLRE